MYQKNRYTKQDPQYIFDFIVNHPFATFVINGDHLLGTHIPILTVGNADDFKLFGHISNEYNKQINYLEDRREALIIFHGPQAYISSSWYKRKGVSTWDYSAIHVNARLKVQTREELSNSLQKLVDHFEHQQEKPLYFDHIPEKMIEGMIPHITGFWAEPFKIEAVAKLHQGYRDEDVDSTIEHLERKEDPVSSQLAESIRKEHNK